ncbi:MAG TPA: hypothetical protein VNX01_03805 [Bacteroidia bacterium]|nr:hypothetical protein [Bacteroidia bacterium]
MATGIVYSIDPAPVGANPTSGQVQQDETGDIFQFTDPNFPNTGLALNAQCTFDIVTSPKDPTLSYATNLQPLVLSPPQSITGPYTGNITANVGDVYTISTAAAVVTGNVTINGGKVIVDQNAQINGSINVSGDGIMVARGGGQVKGGVVMSSGGSLKVVNKGKVTGNISVSQAGRMIVGNANGPGFITGTVDIQKIRAFDITAGSSITGQ